MIYSSFDYDTRKYTYYEGSGVPPATGSFRQPGSAMLPESLLAQLPSDARRVGEGDMPKGIIATTNRSIAGLSSVDGSGFSLWKAGAILAAGVWLGRRMRWGR